MKNKVNKFDLNWWMKHRDRTLEHKWYSIGRIDLLIISISAGGIYVAFETLKFLKENKITHDPVFLKLAGICFAFAIIFNFFSQVFASEAHKCEAKWTRLRINAVRKKPFDIKMVKQLNRNVKIYNDFVLITNYYSIFGMVSGIVVLTIFYLTEV